jgi:hypothetical protein
MSAFSMPLKTTILYGKAPADPTRRRALTASRETPLTATPSRRNAALSKRTPASRQAIIWARPHWSPGQLLSRPPGTNATFFSCSRISACVP